MKKSIRREGYRHPIFSIPKVSIELFIGESEIEVTSILEVTLNEGYDSSVNPSLRLDGEDIRLISVELDELPSPKIIVKNDSLTILNIPKNIANKFTLRIKTACTPASNIECKGLFFSDEILTSHCEPEGFRRITYFLDRPDILSVYTVSIEARKKDYPVLLSGGNLLDRRDVGKNFHRITWHDPQPKSCYLFAIAAGKLFSKEREFVADSGRRTKVQFWANKVDIESVDYAFDCLINAMKWEERKYGLDISMDLYKVVAIKNFPVGGMENKGLNIFSSRLVCTNKDTTTDAGFLAAEGIVAHEFFHNWTGNRVAIKDWFQLSLKEGLTVYRDQEFCSEQSADSAGQSCRRIQVVGAIRAIQFLEDSGSLAHSVLPKSYKKIENFYSATTYIKSAEIIRMLSIVLGAVTFSKCLVLFLHEFDGKPASWEDFFNSFEKISQEDLSNFKNWLYAKGTPRITISEKYSSKNQTYELALKQSGVGRDLLHIPLVTRLTFGNGEIGVNFHKDFLINLKTKKEKLVFEGVTKKPFLSINRNFSSPVVIRQAITECELLRRITFDDDLFIKWDSGFQLFSELILSKRDLSSDALHAIKAIFIDENYSCEFKAQFLTLPQNEYLYGMALEVDPFSIEQSKLNVYKSIAIFLEEELLSQYGKSINSNLEINSNNYSIGDRALKNKCLEMLLLVNKERYLPLAVQQYKGAENLTDAYGALHLMVKYSCVGYRKFMQDFYAKNISNEKNIDMWASLHAIQIPTPAIDVINNLKSLIEVDDFGISNPPRLSSILLSYFHENPISFHDPEGRGYLFWAESILMLDKINPSLSAQASRVLMNWKDFKNANKLKIEKLLRMMIGDPSISVNLEEILNNMLKLQH